MLQGLWSFLIGLLAQAFADAGHCRAFDYPRVLPSLLSVSETRKLTEFYLDQAERTHLRLRREEHPLLLELALKGEHASTVASVIQKVQAAVAESFGNEFFMYEDFFSLRAGRFVTFSPGHHQDAAFWMTDGCEAFNLWVMLDNSQMNASFELFEREHNAELYDHLRRGGTWYLPPAQYNRRSNMKATVLPLQSGDALVVRQPEVHRTDTHQALSPSQWRLGVGFRFLKAGVVKLEPQSVTLYDINFDTHVWPCVFPSVQLGKPLPNKYNVSSVAECTERPALDELRRPDVNQNRAWYFSPQYARHLRVALRRIRQSLGVAQHARPTEYGTAVI